MGCMASQTYGPGYTGSFHTGGVVGGPMVVGGGPFSGGGVIGGGPAIIGGGNGLVGGGYGGGVMGVSPLGIGVNSIF